MPRRKLKNYKRVGGRTYHFATDRQTDSKSGEVTGGGKCTYTLELIICSTSDIFMGVTDNAHHEFSCLTIIQLQRKAVPEPSNRWLSLERRKTGVEHQLDSINNLFREWPDSQECLDCQALEQLVSLRVSTAHEHNHFVIELE